MPEKKNQHYVPQLLLRNFSKNGKSIDLINLNSMLCVRDAAIKNQCSDDYFYGKDLIIENALGDIEGIARSLISGMISTGVAPKQKSNDHYSLLVFTAFQAFRTKFMAVTVNDSIRLMLKKILIKVLESGRVSDISFEELNSTKIGYHECGKLILGFIAMALPLLYDLEMKLLVNETGHGFILGDNPAVLYNMSYMGISHICVTGIQSKGLMMILPVTTKHCLIFYDKNEYKVGGKSLKPITIQNKEDIIELNKLQILNSYDNIYFDKNDEIHLLQIISGVKSYRRDQKVILHESPPEKTNDGFQSIVHTKRSDIGYLAKLGFIKKRKNNREYHLHFGNRDTMLVELFEEFKKLVDKKKYKAFDWNRFIEEKKKNFA